MSEAEVGREQNEMARDSHSYLHFGMVAGIVLLALGLKTTIGDVDSALEIEAAVATLGGTALYLLAHVAFCWRNVHSLNPRRLACAVLLLALVPVAVAVPAVVTIAGLAAILVALIAYEVIRFSEFRDRIRHQPRQRALRVGERASPGRTRDPAGLRLQALRRRLG